jgi:hypothetical protein
MQRGHVAVLVGIGLLGSAWMLRGTLDWLGRGCDLPSPVVYSATRGEPDTFEYCAIREPEPVEVIDSTPSALPEPVTTTVDPAAIAKRERVEAEQARTEVERQARVDACWAAYDDEWAAWDEAYTQWLDETGGQGDYDAWLAENPQPVTPDCEAAAG